MNIAPPTLEAFLAAPLDQVAAAAPATLIFAPGGTRRRAMLEGISPQSAAYADWSRQQMIACCAQWFAHGVKHLFMNVLRPTQLAETGHYREHVLDWLGWGLAGAPALADYARQGWRVRLLGAESIPGLRDIDAHVRAATHNNPGPTLWFFVVPTPDTPARQLLAALKQAADPTPANVIRLLYGEPIPPATMFVGFGKPLLAPDLLPPLLAGDLQCYWTQRPGYDLDTQTLRHIIYDYAYLRATWVPDKSARYNDLTAQRALWDQSLVLGLGARLGSFWYPVQPSNRHSPAE